MVLKQATSIDAIDLSLGSTSGFLCSPSVHYVTQSRTTLAVYQAKR